MRTPSELAPKMAQPGVGARVLIDMSMSMQGFLKGNPIAGKGERVKGKTAKTDSVVLESVLRAVGESLGGANAGQLDYCEVGMATGPEPKCAGVLPDPANYRDTDRFSATKSPIASSLGPREDAVGSEPSAQGIVRGAVDDRRVTVLVTDGVQTDPLDAAGRPRACQSGADLYCLRDVLVARANAGYRIWLIAASVKFDGTVYAEQGMTTQQFEMVKSHLAELRKNPGWNELDRMDVDNFALTPNAKDAKFIYRGARPLLLVVMTLDRSVRKDADSAHGHEFGQAVADGIVDRLKAPTAGLLAPAGRIESVRLNGYSVGKHEFTDFVKQRAKVGVGEDAMAQAEASSKIIPVGGGTRVGPSGLTAALQCVPGDGPAGKGVFQVSWATKQSPDPKLPANCLAERIKVDFSAQPARPGALVAGSVAAGATSHTLKIDCDKMAGKPLNVLGTISAGLAASPNCSGWWDQWSAPDTFSQPEKIALLGDLVGAVMKTNAAAPVAQHSLSVKLDWTQE